MSTIEASRKLRECAEHGNAGWFANIEAAFGVPRYWCGDHVARPDGKATLLAMADEIDREVAELVATLGGERGSTNYYELFGTPERAARTLIVVRGECESVPCSPICPFGDAPACPSNFELGDYDALLEWLRGDAE